MLTQERARELLRYEPVAGVLYWRHRTDMRPQWNGRYADKEAGNVAKNGYTYVNCDGRVRLAHRLIWLIVYGEPAPPQIDHIDHVRTNNKLENLRAANYAINSRNKALLSNNTSGVVGVHWFKPLKMWTAYIASGGKRTTLGYFREFEDAVKARESASLAFDFHANHGVAA